MNKFRKLSVAIFLIFGLAAPVVAQAQDRGTTSEPTGKPKAPAATDSGSAYSPGNPTPNSEVGDHPSSANDQRGYN